MLTQSVICLGWIDKFSVFSLTVSLFVWYLLAAVMQKKISVLIGLRALLWNYLVIFSEAPCCVWVMQKTLFFCQQIHPLQKWENVFMVSELLYLEIFFCNYLALMELDKKWKNIIFQFLFFFLKRRDIYLSVDFNIIKRRLWSGLVLFLLEIKNN